MSAVSGREIYLWRKAAQESAIAGSIDIQEVDWLLQEVTDLDSLALRLESFTTLPRVTVAYSLEELTELWKQRVHRRLPVQYLVGKTNWRKWQLAVSPGVLIPRPETELMVEILRQTPIEVDSESNLVDLGTGSGAIAVSLADSFPKAKVYAVDISSEAIEIARLNARAAKLQDRIEFYLGSWWNPLSHLKGKVTAMVSNPPYIPKGELPSLQPEVYLHEPHLALNGGDDGLDAIRNLVDTAPTFLVSGGLWLVEMMAGQGSEVVRLLQQQGEYRSIQVVPDLAKIDRFVMAYRI